MDDLRVAVLGAGRWGRNLVRNLHELGALTAVADESAAVRDEVLATYPGVKVLEHVDDVLTDDVDAVVVATPAATHADLAIQAIGAGGTCSSRSRSPSPSPTPSASWPRPTPWAPL
jgi:predicted dehydrogenase